MEEEETKKTMCATWREIPCTLWQQMMKYSMTNMKNSDLIAELLQILHDRAKNSHQEGSLLDLYATIQIGERVGAWRKKANVIGVTKPLSWVWGILCREIWH